MSAIHTWACLLLCISYTRQDKPPDAHVTCIFSRECLLPCSFQPAAAGGDADEVIKWYRQKELVYTFFRPRRRDDDSGEELEQSVEDEQYALFPRLVSQGNATLVLRGCGIRDRGRYKCQVHTSAGVHEAHVIVKVEAPIRSLTLKLSRLSGYEEMMCATRDVYPAPDVTWATEPPSFEVLRPTTRKLPDKQSGLYTVESRMRRLKGLSEINYVCKVNSSYGTQAWTASLTERELHGVEGQGLTIPCHAPAYLLHAPAVSWSFAAGGGEVDEHILGYDSASGRSEESASPVWKHAGVWVDTHGVSSGDGSLRLPVPHHAEHSGLYTCVYSAPHHTHTEHIDVVIAAIGEKLQGDSWDPSHWWIVALVVAVVALVLLAMVVYLKLKDRRSKATKSSNEATELYTVKETAVDCTLSECSPLTVEDNNEHNGHKSGKPALR